MPEADTNPLVGNLWRRQFATTLVTAFLHSAHQDILRDFGPIQYLIENQIHHASWLSRLITLLKRKCAWPSSGLTGSLWTCTGHPWLMFDVLGHGAPSERVAALSAREKEQERRTGTLKYDGRFLWKATWKRFSLALKMSTGLEGVLMSLSLAVTVEWLRGRTGSQTTWAQMLPLSVTISSTQEKSLTSSTVKRR